MITGVELVKSSREVHRVAGEVVSMDTVEHATDLHP
jgi:hypothetical protein